MQQKPSQEELFAAVDELLAGELRVASPADRARLRDAAGVSQARLAQALRDATKQTVKNWESGGPSRALLNVRRISGVGVDAAVRSRWSRRWCCGDVGSGRPPRRVGSPWKRAPGPATPRRSARPTTPGSGVDGPYPPEYARRLFDAQAGGGDRQLRDIVAEGLREVYFKDDGRPRGRPRRRPPGHRPLRRVLLTDVPSRCRRCRCRCWCRWRLVSAIEFR